MKFKTYLPIFTGFYGSPFEPDETNEIEYINEIRQDKNLKPINYEDCIFNYDKYYLELSEMLTDEIESQLKEFVYSIEFEKLKSPKFYNFENDSIHCKIKPNKKAILNYIKNNFDLWAKYLKENYSSCSGFISHYSNNPNSKDWNNYNLINGTHQLGSVLNFIAMNEDITECDIYDWVLGNISLECENFDKLTK